jgi:hypothetical protein
MHYGLDAKSFSSGRQRDLLFSISLGIPLQKCDFERGTEDK